jgi:hypothetical protein
MLRDLTGLIPGAALPGNADFWPIWFPFTALIDDRINSLMIPNVTSPRFGAFPRFVLGLVRASASFKSRLPEGQCDRRHVDEQGAGDRKAARA